jgi:hypothetical protein
VINCAGTFKDISEKNRTLSILEKKIWGWEENVIARERQRPSQSRQKYLMFKSLAAFSLDPYVASLAQDDVFSRFSLEDDVFVIKFFIITLHINALNNRKIILDYFSWLSYSSPVCIRDKYHDAHNKK